jgi:hydrogenase nickel incorporation protein HypA/HybF
MRGVRLDMHELAIAQSIVEIVETRAAECHATHVKGVRLRIGEAIGVVTDSLTFCFEMLTSLDPTLAGAQLLIDTVPHQAQCHHCAREFPVVNFSVPCVKNGLARLFLVPNCKSLRWNMKLNRDPIMHFNNIIHPSVGADLSSTPPIYRPSWISRTPDEIVTKHNQPNRREWRLCPK